MTEQERDTRGPSGILLALRAHWIIAIIAASVVIIPAGVVISTQQPDYQSDSVVGLVPTRTQSDAFLRAVAQQLPTYLLSPEVTARVGETVGLTGEDVVKATSVEIPAATLNLTTTVLYSDPDIAARLANEMSAEALKNKDYKEFFSPILLSPAIPAEKPNGLGRAVLFPLVVVVAVIVAAVAALVARDLKAAGQRELPAEAAAESA